MLSYIKRIFDEQTLASDVSKEIFGRKKMQLVMRKIPPDIGFPIRTFKYGCAHGVLLAKNPERNFKIWRVLQETRQNSICSVVLSLFIKMCKRHHSVSDMTVQTVWTPLCLIPLHHAQLISMIETVKLASSQHRVWSLRASLFQLKLHALLSDLALFILSLVANRY